jgi:hypothetical protein
MASAFLPGEHCDGTGNNAHDTSDHMRRDEHQEERRIRGKRDACNEDWISCQAAPASIADEPCELC